MISRNDDAGVVEKYFNEEWQRNQ